MTVVEFMESFTERMESLALFKNGYSGSDC